MTELADNGLLTDAERFAAAHRGGHQRALALLALEQYGPLLGIDSLELQKRAETVRSLGKEAARKFRKGLEQVGQALQTIGVLEEPGVISRDLTTLSEDASISSEAETPEAKETGLEAIDEQTNDSTDPSDDAQAPDEHITEEPVPPSRVMRIFLKDITGHDVESYTTADIKAVSQQIVSGGFLPATRQQSNGSKIDAERRLERFFATNGNLRAVAAQEGSNAAAVSAWFGKIREKALAAQDKVAGKLTAPGERKLDEEQVYVQLAEGWADYLQLDHAHKVALQEMLDPQGSQKISDNKQVLASRFWDILVDRDGQVKSFNIEQKKLAQVYRLFGIGFNALNKRAQHVQNGPDMLARRVAAARNAGNNVVVDDMIQNTHKGMGELLDILKEERGVGWEKVPELGIKLRPMQVELVDGIPKLV